MALQTPWGGCEELLLQVSRFLEYACEVECVALPAALRRTETWTQA